MKLVHSQIEIIRKLLDGLDNKTGERSHWTFVPPERMKARIAEAQAIEDAARSLVAIVRTARPDYDREIVLRNETKEEKQP